MDKQKVTECLNRAMNLELEGALEYLYLSFNVFGSSRRLLQGFLREQAQEGIDHAVKMAEKITSLGGVPHMSIRIDYQQQKFTTKDILERGLEREKKALNLYKESLPLVEDDVALEELLRGQVAAEQEHIEEVSKLLREN
ncbi:MAG: ferritin-like domain-containing protein [Acidobacteriota bacterium]